MKHRPVTITATHFDGNEHVKADVGKGFFHQWGTEFEEFESGPVNYTVAIIEKEDGSIETPLPHNIRFEDGHGSEEL